MQDRVILEKFLTGRVSAEFTCKFSQKAFSHHCYSLGCFSLAKQYSNLILNNQAFVLTHGWGSVVEGWLGGVDVQHHGLTLI